MDGWKYRGPFDDLPAEKQPGGWVDVTLRHVFKNVTDSAVQAHRIVLWDEVGEAEGTGIVHIAPGCGAEDYQLHKQYGLPVVAPLDENGFYVDGFAWLSGQHVSQVTGPIVEDLKQKGIYYNFKPYVHRYPECWRCHTPLVFRLVDEWFVSMDGLRAPLMDITNQIRWVPEYGREREIDWLRNMHDWMISKKRYYGLALPIWECSHCGGFDVIGSREELRDRAVEGWEDFDGHSPHRPYIDRVKIACSHCGGMSSRIPEVGNPWLDAGIVSLSTMRFGTDMDYWRKWFPADFITESFPGQFRNWFYALLTMAGGVAHQPASRTILGYGTLVAEDGQAMHKSRGNMIEFNEAADSIGADVMRWLFAGQRYDADLIFGYHAADETRRLFLLPLWNVYNFFITYANLDGWKPGPVPEGESNTLDRWILARLQQVTREVTAALDDYTAYQATRPVETFLDDLSNWYVRRSRRRFWKSESDADKQSAYATLYHVLVTLTKLLAPFVPFVTEAMYQNLVRQVDAKAPESVHHCRWPAVDSNLLDTGLLADMEAARMVVTLGHAVRAGNNLKVRQPLARAILVAPPAVRESLAHLSGLVVDELNVKSLEFATNETDLVTYKLLPDNRTLGPKFGAQFPKVRQALAAADPIAVVHALRAGQRLELEVDGRKVELTADQVVITPLSKSGFAVRSEGAYVVALDTQLTPELVAEGQAREFVRRVQDLRKTAGFEIADRIKTYFQASPRLEQAIRAHADYIKNETLSLELSVAPAPEGSAINSDRFDEETLTIALTKA